MTLLPGRDLGSELGAPPLLHSALYCNAVFLLHFLDSSTIVLTTQPSHADQSWPNRTATFGNSMRGRPHVPTNPSQWHYVLPDAGQAVGAPVIELTTRSRAQPLFIPARRAREPRVSRFSPAPRWGLPFLLLSHPVPSSVRLPCLRRRPFRRKLGGCRRMPPSRSHARTRPLPAGLRSLFPRFASTATGPYLIRGPDFTWRPPPLRLGGLRFGGGYLATAKHSGPTRRQAPPLHQAKQGNGSVALMIKRADSARGAPTPLGIFVALTSSRSADEFSPALPHPLTLQ